MAELDIEETNNNFSKIRDVEITNMGSHNSEETIDVMNVNIDKIIVSDAFASCKTKKADAK